MNGDMFYNPADLIYKPTPIMPPIEVPSLPTSMINPAKWAYVTLGERISEFEAGLDNEHEVGARLVSFGQTVIFHIERISYHGTTIIAFDGINDAGEKVQLIQHVSQLSVLLMAVKKLQEKPRRIGFRPNKEDIEA